jgi:predicted DNA binding protein
MRTATVRLSPPAEGLHPADAEVAAHPELQREAIDHITGLADGSGVLLCRIRGDAGTVRTVLDETPRLRDHNVTAAETTVYVYMHFEPTGTAEALLELRRSHELVVRMPMQWLSNGNLEVSAVGDDATLQAAVSGLPAEVGVHLVELREYEPDADRPTALLTDRQLDVLDAALEVGYYEQPRRGTQANVADAVGLAPATVGEHLRRIEGTVLRSLRE